MSAAPDGPISRLALNGCFSWAGLGCTPPVRSRETVALQPPNAVTADQRAWKLSAAAVADKVRRPEEAQRGWVAVGLPAWGGGQAMAQTTGGKLRPPRGKCPVHPLAE